MRVPFDIFDVQYRLSGRGLEPFFQILAADFPDSPFLQGIIRFFTLEVVGDLGIEIGIIVSGSSKERYHFNCPDASSFDST